MSIMSPASSRWSRPSAIRGSPTSRITVSWSVAVGSGRFGSVARTICRRSSASRARSVSALTWADMSRMRSSSGPASSPARFAAAIESDAAFCSARSRSAEAVAPRQSSSRSSTSSRRETSPRRASAARTASGSRRISLRSSILRAGYAAQAAASLAGDARDVLADGLDLRGVERALERRHPAAAVRDLRLRGLLVGLEVVEVRSDLALRVGVLERVAGGALLAEYLLALGRRLLRAARAGARRPGLRAARRPLRRRARRPLGRRARPPLRRRARRPLRRRARRPRRRRARAAALAAAARAGDRLARRRDRRRALAAGVLGDECGDRLGVLPDHDVLGHDRAGEAAVADRVEDAVGRLGAHVEVRPVGALAVVDARRAALRPGHVERVAARAALGEEVRSVLHLLARTRLEAGA